MVPSRSEVSPSQATLEAAKAEFEASWRQWLAWAKLEEVP
jgi:predicted lipoprotein